MSAAKLIIFVSFTLVVGKTNIENQIRIVNGVNCSPGEFSFMVSIQNNGRHYCGGTVVNQLFILTAAHCVCTKQLQNLEIFITKSNRYDDVESSVKIPNDLIICHDYSEIEKINDIALLKLTSEIPDNFYTPVPLPSSTFTTNQNGEGILIGWGLTATHGILPKVLQKVEVIVFNDTICGASWYGMYDMKRNMCAGWPEDGRGSCQGDSGGPLMANGVQVGVIGFGVSGNCGISNMNFPKVLTRVTEYMNWIHENTKVLPPPDEPDTDADDPDTIDNEKPEKDGSSHIRITNLIIILALVLLI